MSSSDDRPKFPTFAHTKKKKIGIQTFITILDSAWKMHESEYKQAYFWYSIFWDSQCNFKKM